MTRLLRPRSRRGRSQDPPLFSTSSACVVELLGPRRPLGFALFHGVYGISRFSVVTDWRGHETLHVFVVLSEREGTLSARKLLEARYLRFAQNDLKCVNRFVIPVVGV